MPARNRSRYSDDNGGGSTAVRTIGAFLLCAILSFGLGFFVLARFWSSKPKSDAEAASKNAIADSGSLIAARHGDDTPASMRTSLPSGRAVRPSNSSKVIPPRIDPVEEAVQKPSSVNPDEAKQTDAVKNPDETPAAKNSGADDPTADTPASDPPAPLTTKRRRHRKPAQPAEEQIANTPDGETAPPDSTDDVNDAKSPKRVRRSAAATEASNGLYRVQIGVYSTREKAEEQSKAASEKGFDSSVMAVTTGDRTLYRVQHSAHRSRTNAETEKQRLVDAGLDAYISNP